MNPDRMLRLECAEVGVSHAAFAHRVGELVEPARERRGEQKFRRSASVSRRLAVEKNGAVWPERVAVPQLFEKPEDGEIIAKDSHTARRCVATRGNFSSSCGRVADCGEQIQLECRFQRRALLVGSENLKK